MLRHRIDRLGHPPRDPSAPTFVHERTRVGKMIAGDAESQPVVHAYRNLFFRLNANESVALRPTVPPLERQPVIAMRRQKGDESIDDANLPGVLIDAEDQPPRRRHERRYAQVQKEGDAED